MASDGGMASDGRMALRMASICLSHKDASTDMRNDLFRSLHDLELRSNFDLELLR